MNSHYVGAPRNEVELNKFGQLLQSVHTTKLFASIAESVDIVTVDIDTASTHVCIDVEQSTTSTIAIAIAEDKVQELDIEIFVHKEAKCRIIFLQNIVLENVSIRQKSSIADGAHLHFQTVSLGGKNFQYCIENILKGANAISDIDWVFYAKNTEDQSLDSRNVFNANNGGGEIVMKGIAEDTASVRCNGMIEIGLEGKGTDTYLTEDVLMLDTTAKVDAIPGLEIKTNDVKASHSATVSQITPADLFYFAARGIPENTARKMYIEGFLGGITEGMPESIREIVLEAIDIKYSK